MDVLERMLFYLNRSALPQVHSPVSELPYQVTIMQPELIPKLILFHTGFKFWFHIIYFVSFSDCLTHQFPRVLSVNYYAAVNYFKVTFISYRFPVLVSHYISLVSEPVLHINFRGSFVWTCQLYLSSICFENRTMTFFTGPDGSTPQSHLSIFQRLPR